MTFDVSITDESAQIPVVVDMDGTLIATDVLVEGAVVLLKRNPLSALRMLGWLTQGKAQLKARIAEQAPLDVAHLPYRPEVLEYLQAARAQGRRVVLATAADARVAQQVADRLGLFDTVLASDGELNLTGEQKRRRLVAELGEKGFDYLGNARPDIAVWRSARTAVVVGGSAALRRRVAEVATLGEVLDGGRGGPADYVGALRLHHWLKNLLVFAPLLAAHQITQPAPLGQAGLAFLAFSLCASAVYLFNDLMDLEADRHHPHKRQRPIPAGRVPVKWALTALPILLITSLALALMLPWGLITVISVYLGLNLAYSLSLKAVPILDVLILAGLYTLRIIAGSVATDAWMSTWLLAFSMFLFLSLALVKRYAELHGHARRGRCARQGPWLPARRCRAARLAGGRRRLSRGAGAGALHRQRDQPCPVRPPPGPLGPVRAAAVLDKPPLADGPSQTHGR